MNIEYHGFRLASFGSVVEMIQNDLFSIHIGSLKLKRINLRPLKFRVQKWNILSFELLLCAVISLNFLYRDLVEITIF